MIDWQYQTKNCRQVVYRSDKGTEEHDLEKLGKDNEGKSALFNLNDTAIL